MYLHKLLTFQEEYIKEVETLTLSDVSHLDAGWYTCLYSNHLGYTYQSIWLTVTGTSVTNIVLF